MAANSKEKTGEKLLTILESRLDNVVYRLGFASSRAQARMLVTHATFDVNGRKVNIPSFLVKPGDVISVREIKKENGTIKTSVEANEARPVPTWLEKEEEKLSGKVVKISFKRRY
jgi:small subunit ribosomal protein S4